MQFMFTTFTPNDICMYAVYVYKMGTLSYRVEETQTLDAMWMNVKLVICDYGAD